MAPPKKLGKYHVQSLLGKGSMGVVYKALDPVMDRIVAIKTLRTGLVDQDEKENTILRFKAEARAYGRLLHPNIVACFECDESDGVIYIVLEYVEGKSLKQMFDRDEVFSLDRTRYLMRQLLQALAYSHDRGVIHRDIKPANLLVMADDQVKVTDFGIARIDTSTLTQTGMVMGSPSYMAPEQFSGGRVDHRADIFAAAVIFYQMLTNKRPFGGSDLGEVLHNVLSVVPPLPSKLNPAIPRSLDRIVMQALSKEASGRFQSATEFVSALMSCDFALNKLDEEQETRNEEELLVATSDNMGPSLSGALHAVKTNQNIQSLIHDDKPDSIIEKTQQDLRLHADTSFSESAERAVEVAGVEKSSVPTGSMPVNLGFNVKSSLDMLKKWWLPTSASAVAVFVGILVLVSNGTSEKANVGAVTASPPETHSDSTAVATADPVAASIPSTSDPAADVNNSILKVSADAPTAIPDSNVPSFDLAPVTELTQVIPCGKVEARLTGNEVVLQGFVGNEEDREGLSSAVNRVAGGRTVRSDISVLMWPYCELLPMISGLVRGQDVAENVSNRNHVTYREGDNLVLDLTTPNFPSYVYVDYFLLDGSVVHLFPSGVQNENSVQPNQTLRIGDGPKAKKWEISPPFGEEMITIIASARPLFKEPRTEVEKADVYLSALDAGIRSVDMNEVLANFTFVQTSAKGP